MKIVAEKEQEEAEHFTLRKHPLYKATPQQIDSWIDANVTNLQSAKAVLKVLAKMQARRR